MTIYTVMSPPPSGDETGDAERVAFVKEGFCWPALVIPALWLLWHRMWLVLAGYLATVVTLSIIGGLLNGPAGAVPAVVLAFLFALEANGLRRWTLERNGWQFSGIVSGANREECETRFFHQWVAEAAVRAASQPNIALRSTRGETSHGDEAVLGLFPSPEKAR